MIKKILLFSFIIIIIPFFIVTIFVRDNTITFNYTSNTVVRVYRQEKNQIDIVPFEEYIIGVLAGEMPVEFSIEALKAQAVAARSYVMKQMEYNINNEYDVIDTVKNQVYLDKKYLISVWSDSYIVNINKLKEAVLATKGEYISYNNKVVDALFFSTSPGKTENSEEVFSSKEPYLRSVESFWDEISPAYNSIKNFSKQEFYELLGLSYNENLNIEVLDTTSTGRIKKIKINENIFTGSEICIKLSLKSSYFEIVEDKDILVKVKGYGHGVGMSQYGAEGMAREGYNYKDILKYYYTGIEIKKINV